MPVTRAPSAVVVERVRELTGDEGFDAQTEQYRNLVDAGVIDPTKVVLGAPERRIDRVVTADHGSLGKSGAPGAVAQRVARVEIDRPWGRADLLAFVAEALDDPAGGIM
jgi:hypothetical protein